MEELIQFLFNAFLVIVGLYLAWLLLLLVAAIVVISLLAVVYWGPLAALIMGVRYASYEALLRYNLAGSRVFRPCLAADSSLKFDVEWGRDGALCLASNAIVTLVAVAGCYAAWMLISHYGISEWSYEAWSWLLQWANWALPLQWQISVWNEWPPKAIAMTASIFVAVLVGVVSGDDDFYIGRMAAYAHKLAHHFNQQSVDFKQFRAIEDEISSYCARLDVGLICPVTPALEAVVNWHRHSLLQNQQAFLIDINAVLKQARADSDGLKSCVAPYEAAQALCTEVVHTGVVMGSRSLIEYLDGLKDTLDSDDIRVWLAQRDWAVFRGLVADITQQLNQLKTLDPATAAGWNGPPPGQQNDMDSEDIKDEERACKILNVPLRASMSQIESAYKVGRSIWHPDKGVADDDKQFKMIQAAYEFLKARR